jgi:hypothetical protein
LRGSPLVPASNKPISALPFKERRRLETYALNAILARWGVVLGMPAAAAAWAAAQTSHAAHAVLLLPKCYTQPQLPPLATCSQTPTATAQHRHACHGHTTPWITQVGTAGLNAPLLLLLLLCRADAAMVAAMVLRGGMTETPRVHAGAGEAGASHAV